MRFIKIIVCFLLVALIIGCGERPVYSKKIDINGTWSNSNKLSYPIEIDNLDETYDLILSLTYGTDFGYQNMYVKIITEYPDGKKIEDILSLNLTDGMGMFLGDCSSSKCEIDLLLQQSFKFDKAGKYVITIIQNGREDNLENVYAAELKLYNFR